MTREKVVLDSCVFNKLFLDEFDSDQAVQLVDYLITSDYKILAPTLFVYEVLNVIQKSTYPAEKVYEAIKEHQKINLEIIEINNEIVDETIKIANQGHPNSGYPSFYDSSYHALALLNNCHFITADKKHNAKTEHIGNIILLEDWESIKNH